MVATAGQQIAANANANNNYNAFGKFVYGLKAYGGKGDGSTDDYSKLYALINTTINGAKATIVIYDGDYRLASNITIPSNVTLWFLNGGTLKPDSGKTVTINGPISAGFYQIFSGSGTIICNAKIKEYYPEWYGAVGDGVTNNATAFSKMIASVPTNGVIYFQPGNYYTNQAITITRYVTLRGGDNGWVDGTKITFDNCDGLIFNVTYCVVESLELYGVNKPTKTVSDIQSGNVGIRGIVVSSLSGGATTKDVRIYGFNVGVCMYNASGATSAGAYRDFYRTLINYNDVGIYAVDGATHNKFIGGVMANNALFGIYTTNTIYYTELEIIGMTCELNGTFGGNYPSNDYTKCGIYAASSSRVFMTNSYVESQRHYADIGGTIHFSGSHTHPSTTHFYSRGTGTITQSASFNNYAVKKKVTPDLKTKFAYTNCTASDIAGIATSGAAVRVTATANSTPTMNIQFSEATFKTIIGSELEWVKFSIKVHVSSGTTATNFGITPLFKMRSINTSNDAFAASRTLPMEIYDFTRTPYEKIEFYYYVRKLAGTYLDPNDFLSFYDFGLTFSNGSTPNYTTTNLIVDVYDPSIEFFSTTDINIS